MENVESIWDEVEELQSLGIDVRDKAFKGDKEELGALADVIKNSMYQDYKLAYSNEGEEHEDEAKATPTS